MKHMLQLVFVSAFFVSLTAGAGWGQLKAAAAFD